MHVADALQRELVYHLNALLLRASVPSAQSLAQTLLQVLEAEGPRHHEPSLLRDWADAVVIEPEELVFELEDVLETVVAELEDDEEPWSAHRLLDLLAAEPIWPITWCPTGTVLPAAPRRARGVALPIDVRPGLVAILDELELRLFEANQDQRSVHDGLPASIIERVVDAAIAAITDLRSDRRPVAMTALLRPPRGLPTLREALVQVQQWKLSVTFDAAPDDDDGEWTLRVLERLYGIEWATAVSSRT